MSNPSNYIALVAQCFLDDDVLAPMVDYNIIPGFRRALADDYLTGTNKTCVGVRNLNLNTEDLGGCAYHGLSMNDMLIEISITSIADNDTYISSVVHEIMRIMKRPLTKTIGGISYSVYTNGRGSFKPVNDPAFADRVEMTGTFRLGFIDD
ncbi:hypothetical protein M0R72_08600 [Candidatus Pacearchaeota archaeon]|jgi:hypothetical protein|nr:hypothetical protein [Candidatus Pacearchaeota archaeon]